MKTIKFRAIRKTDIGNGRPVYFFTLEQVLRGEYNLLLPEHYHISQFTKLHDKNGKEIYEGDIVEWDDESGGKYWLAANNYNDQDFLIQRDGETIILYKKISKFISNQ